jgi:hypothetical protein
MNSWIVYLNLAVPFIVKLFIPDGRCGNLTILTDFIVLPLMLTILNIVILLNKISVSHIKCFSLMLIGLLLGNAIGYIIWGISSKRLLKPDGETLWIIKSLSIYHICYVIGIFILFVLGKYLFHLLKCNCR